MIDKSKPAFPRSETGSAEIGQIDPGAPGMTLREYYAGLAMQGMIVEGGRFTEPDIVAQFAIAQADALIAALQEDSDES